MKYGHFVYLYFGLFVCFSFPCFVHYVLFVFLCLYFCHFLSLYFCLFALLSVAPLSLSCCPCCPVVLLYCFPEVRKDKTNSTDASTSKRRTITIITIKIIIVTMIIDHPQRHHQASAMHRYHGIVGSVLKICPVKCFLIQKESPMAFAKSGWHGTGNSYHYIIRMREIYSFFSGQHSCIWFCSVSHLRLRGSCMVKTDHLPALQY